MMTNEAITELIYEIMNTILQPNSTRNSWCFEKIYDSCRLGSLAQALPRRGDLQNNVLQNYFQRCQTQGLQFQLDNPQDELVVHPHLLGHLCPPRHCDIIISIYNSPSTFLMCMFSSEETSVTCVISVFLISILHIITTCRTWKY